MEPSPCASDLVLTSIHNTSWEIFITLTGLRSWLLNRQQRTLEDIHLLSGAVGVCWYLLVTAHIQIKDWT